MLPLVYFCLDAFIYKLTLQPIAYDNSSSIFNLTVNITDGEYNLTVSTSHLPVTVHTVNEGQSLQVILRSNFNYNFTVTYGECSAQISYISSSRF